MGKDREVKFFLPSARGYYLIMKKDKDDFKFQFYHEGKLIHKAVVPEFQMTRENLRRLSVNAGIEFYALTGPYDVADEILRKYHKYFTKKSLFQRILGL